MGANNDSMTIYLENKNVYCVYDEGYFYHNRMTVCDTKEEAINYWKKLTGISYSRYDEYIKNAYHGEGHWYYSIEEENLSEYFEKCKEITAHRAIRDREEKIKEEGNEMINIAATKAERNRITTILKGLYYYLETTIGYSDIGLTFDNKKKIFIDSLKDII